MTSVHWVLSVGPNVCVGVFQQAMLSYPYLRPYTKDGMPIGKSKIQQVMVIITLLGARDGSDINRQDYQVSR